MSAWLVAGRPEAIAPEGADHAALDTAIGMSAVLAAVVIGARMTRELRWDDLLLTAALTVMAAASLVWRVFIPESAEAEFTHASAGRLVGVALMLIAAMIPRERTVPGAQPMRPAAGILIVGGVCALAAGVLAIDTTLRTHEVSRSIAWIALGVTLVAVLAAFRKQRITGDPLWGWLAVALAVFSAARLQVALSVDGHPEFLGGDLLPLIGYGCVVVAVVAEAKTYWQARARDEAAGEARRMAERVHEGLLQEIVYARRTARDGMPDPTMRGRTEQALMRAESRARELMHAIVEKRPPDFASALDDAVRDSGERLGIEVKATIARNLDPAPQAGRALIYAATEGIANAARHSGASVVTVDAYARGPHVVLRVRDSGRGAHGTTVQPGFGLESVHAAVRACGGTLTTASPPNRGTTLLVEV